MVQISKLFEAEGLASKQDTESLTRRLVWSRDASHFRVMPGATHKATDLESVAKLLGLANQHGYPVTFRSGGSSLSGQTVGHGVVVDTRSGLQSLVSIGEDSITAQPGVTLARLNGHLSRRGRKVGPDPASMVASTLGGAVSNNSSGMTCGTELNSYRTIRSAKIAFADGQILDTSAADADTQLRAMRPDIYKLLENKREQIRSNQAHQEKIRHLFRLKNTMGYSLNAFLDFDSPVEILLRLLVGAEGTLAFLGQVELATVETLPYRSANLLLFDDLESANAAIPGLIDQSPAAIELIDATSLAALRAESMLPDPLADMVTQTAAAVLVEFEAFSEEELSSKSVRFEKTFAKPIVFAQATGQLRNDLWAMRKGLYAVVAKARPAGTTALLEDVAVPPEKLTEACRLLSEACEAFGYGKPVIFGHVRDGNIHFMISDDFSDQKRIETFQRFTDRMVEIVLGLEGNLKAEHGTGRAMAPFVERQFGAELYEILLEIKRGFDPNNILNPGVIFPSSATDYLENLKSVSQVSEIVDSCVECGYCESSCPSAGLTLTPRERIVAHREQAMLSSRERKQLEKQLKYQVEQTCAVDGMCAVNCPVGINTGTFVKELRAESQGSAAARLAKMVESNWGVVTSLARVGLRAAQLLPRTANLVSRAIAGLLPKGLFPTWTKNVSSNGYSRASLRSRESKVAFLPSCMNEIFGEPELHRFLELTAQLGHPLEIPQSSRGFCCGTPFSSKGLTSATNSRKGRNSSILSQLQHQTIVIDGSSCHQTLLEQDSTRVIELSQFVAQNLISTPVKTRIPRVVLHPTCSGEKTGSNRAMVAIAQAISDEVIVPADWRCCGFAGDRGMLIPELTSNATSLEAIEVADTDAVFVSNNQPCQIGMSGATDRNYRSILSVWLEAVL